MRPYKTIEWTEKGVRLIDQTLLPRKVKYLLIRDEKAMFDAIGRLVVRGAPAIGVAAAYGLVLGVRVRKPRTVGELKRYAKSVSKYLAKSRPTAVNLFWALRRMEGVAETFTKDDAVHSCMDTLIKEAMAIQQEDELTCALIGKHGAPLLKDCSGVLTHCNAGALATAGDGTAVAVITHAARGGGKFTVYADETRPLLQGARLTAWELMQEDIETRVITDNTAGIVLQRGLVQAVVVGSDRIAANGDAANKIGTMPLAIVAKHYKVPFYVAAPLSTFDMELASGDDIPIEERSQDEVLRFAGTPTAPKGAKAYTPAFDVTPNPLIAGIVTEKGVLTPPYKSAIKKAFAT